MPLARYFFYVGGVMLALLLILDAYLPKFPVADRAHADLPVIRIHSDRKWPERIVYDTSIPMIIPAQIAGREASILTLASHGGRRLCYVEGAGGICALQPSDVNQLTPSHPN